MRYSPVTAKQQSFLYDRAIDLVLCDSWNGMVETSSSVTSTSVEIGFKALSDPLRIQILELLREQELCVCDLCDRLDVRQSKLSFHLKNLKESSLLRSRQQGKWVYYSLNLPQFALLEQYLSDFRRFSPMLPSRVCPENESDMTP